MKTLVALTEKQIYVIMSALRCYHWWRLTPYENREDRGKDRASDNAEKALRDGTTFTKAEAAALWSALNEGMGDMDMRNTSDREYALMGRAMDKLSRII